MDITKEKNTNYIPVFLRDRITRASLPLVDCSTIERTTERIGSTSMHAEVYVLESGAVAKCVPESVQSLNELNYLELLSVECTSGRCENFPILYTSLQCKNIQYNNDTLQLQSFEKLTENNKDVCERYIKKHLRTIRDHDVHDMLSQRPMTTCRVVQSCWNFFSRYTSLRNHGYIPDILSNVFIVERANGDLKMLLENHRVSLKDMTKLVFSILYALWYLNDTLKLKHGDLHIGNILLLYTRPRTKTYDISGNKYFVQEQEYTPILWDFETMEKIDQNNTDDLVKLLDSLRTNTVIRERQSKRVWDFLMRIPERETIDWVYNKL